MTSPDRLYSTTATTLPAAPLDSDIFRVASSVLPRPTPRPIIGSFPRVCGCGRSFSAAEWAQLPDAAIWDLRPEGDLLEQRSCVCLSSLCVVLEE